MPPEPDDSVKPAADAPARLPQHPLPPPDFTPPIAEYKREMARLHGFQAYFWGVATFLEDHEEELVRCLQERSDDPLEPEDYDPEFHESLLNEWVLCRVVDNFEVYLTELLRFLLTYRPEMLSSSDEKVELTFVVGNMDRLTEALADRKVRELSYRSLASLSDYCQKNWAFPLLTGSYASDQAEEIVALRNLLVHARGVVNPYFLEQVGFSQYALGQRVEVSYELLTEAISNINQLVEDIDRRAAVKFWKPPLNG